jgi:hypothetical protein
MFSFPFPLLYSYNASREMRKWEATYFDFQYMTMEMESKKHTKVKGKIYGQTPIEDV